MRLARGGIGEEIYHRENAAFRDTGRRLSGVRDASVMVETLHELEKFFGDELPRGAPDELHERFEEERKQALESLSADDGVLARAAPPKTRRPCTSGRADDRDRPPSQRAPAAGVRLGKEALPAPPEAFRRSDRAPLAQPRTATSRCGVTPASKP